MPRYSQRRILAFWAPLAATWAMMASEGPFLAAVIARLPDATHNLAAHGVAWALAILAEAPVIMLMSAATSLVRDRSSFLELRAFSRVLALGTTSVLAVLLLPPVYDRVTGSVMGLPPEVAEITHGALRFFLPWPAAIGYRRLLQGVLIREGRTRQVAYGTVIRLSTMTAVAVAGYLALDVPGAWVAAMALSSGVVAEAGAARLMVAGTLRELLAGERDEGEPRRLGLRGVASFYVPLALTSLIGLSVQPMLTFFMGRSVAPIESLAVFPVVHALSFFFRALGLAFQDTAIALAGERFEHFPELRRFATGLGAATSLALAAVVLTPLSHVYFVQLSGLDAALAGFANVPARLVVPLPALSVLLSFQRAILVESRRTRHITEASALEVGTIAAVFVLLGWGLDLVGATAAFAAFLTGRVLSNTRLWFACRRALAERAR
ncbi:MAG TPA: hypothetical protein VFQ22_04255 [Longimicrobiales bacterium]|nr:hypothetical protein [Longimicrobiales bacterium]